jgi:hypothetical protein
LHLHVRLLLQYIHAYLETNLSMENLDLIIENYKRLSDEELIRKANDPGSLRPEIIPHLQSELSRRNRDDAASLLTEYLTNKPKAYKDYSEDEMLEMIHQRITNGESMEHIKIDLKDSGINILDYFGASRSYEQRTMGYIAGLKEEGYDEAEIDERIKTEFELSPEETDLLKNDVRKKGRNNITIGLIMVIVFGVLSIILYSVRNQFSKLFIILIIAGIALIIKGNKWSE